MGAEVKRSNGVIMKKRCEALELENDSEFTIDDLILLDEQALGAVITASRTIAEKFYLTKQPFFVPTSLQSYQLKALALKQHGWPVKKIAQSLGVTAIRTTQEISKAKRRLKPYTTESVTIDDLIQACMLREGYCSPDFLVAAEKSIINNREYRERQDRLLAEDASRNLQLALVQLSDLQDKLKIQTDDLEFFQKVEPAAIERLNLMISKQFENGYDEEFIGFLLVIKTLSVEGLIQLRRARPLAVEKIKKEVAAVQAEVKRLKKQAIVYADV